MIYHYLNESNSANPHEEDSRIKKITEKQYILEITPIVDFPLAKLFKFSPTAISKYFKLFFIAVQQKFHNMEPPHLSLKVSEIVVLNSTNLPYLVYEEENLLNPQATLNKLLNWKHVRKIKSDFLYLITSTEFETQSPKSQRLCSTTEDGRTTAGGIGYDNGKSSGITLAVRSIAGSLGVSNDPDGSGKCSKARGFIMGDWRSKNVNNIKFSPCSIETIHSNIQNRDKFSCLDYL